MRTVAALLFLIQSTDFSAEGLKALEERRYDAAVQSFTKAIEADAKDYSAHFNLALAYSFLNRDDEGIAEYRKTLELKPGLASAEVNEGMLLFRQKRPADALPLLEDAARQKPKDFQALYYLAQCQLETGALAKAQENFQAAIEINSKSAAAELGLAHVLARLQQLSAAAPHFRQAAQLDAGHRDALLELADLYERNKQIPEALAIYREFPDDAAVQEHAGALMLQNNQYADAIPSLERAYAKSPTAANRVALAMAYQFNKQVEKALPLFDKAAAADPGSFDIRMMYARALRDAKQYPAAIRQFNEAVKIGPSDMHAWSDLASMLYINGDLQDSLAAFDRARQLGENTPGNWFLRAIILDKLRQLKPALEAYRQFLSMSHGENARSGISSAAARQDYPKRIGEAVMRIRSILAVLLALGAVAILHADLKKALAEPDLEKRSKLALENAFAAYQAARNAYQKGEMQQVQASIDEVEQSVDLGYQSLNDTGKNPRRSPKWFKSAELATRDLLRRIASFQDEMSYSDRPMLDKLKARVQHVHDDLLLGLMEGRKK